MFLKVCFRIFLVLFVLTLCGLVGWDVYDNIHDSLYSEITMSEYEYIAYQRKEHPGIAPFVKEIMEDGKINHSEYKSFNAHLNLVRNAQAKEIVIQSLAQ